jgi:hypothetical protein
MAGWSATNTPGGHDQARGRIPETDWRKAPAAGQGSTLAAFTGDGTNIWEGRIGAVPQIKGGIASLAAQGMQYQARKMHDRLLIRSDGLDQWALVESDPLSGGDSYRKVLVNIDRRAEFSVNEGDSLVAGGNSRNGIAFYAEGIPLDQVKFTMAYNSADATNNLELQTVVVDGPAIGAGGVQDTYATSAGNIDATKTSNFGVTPFDTVIIYLHVNTNFTPASRLHFILKNLSVYSAINTTDTFHAYQVLAYIGDQFGWDTAGVQSSTFNILPFDHVDDWGSNADYVSELEDRWWRVLDDRGSGPYLESGTWANSTNWTVSMGENADPNLLPLELFDKVVVHYETPAGVLRQKSATSTSISVGNAFEITLEDRQSDPALASAVASALLTKYSTQRYSGMISVVAARDNTGRTNPYLIRHGDTITVADWDVGASITLRVEEVEYTPQEVRVGIESSVNELALIKKARRRMKKLRMR